MTEPTFEVRAFRALPAAADVAVLVLEGRFTASAPRSLGRPHLLVEEGEAPAVDVAAVLGPQAAAGPGGVPWRAAFAVPLGVVPRASFALALGNGLLVDLPAPDLGERRDDDPSARLARLAREANELRGRVDAATAQAAEARAAADEARTAADEASAIAEAAGRDRDAALSELDIARAELVAGAAAAKEEAARAAQAARDETARRLEESLATQRARADAARRDLQAARAEIEHLRSGRTGPVPTPEPAPPPRPPQPASEARTTEVPSEPAPEPEPDPAVTEPLPPTEERIRVLSRRPRRRHTSEDETEPVDLSPGATKIGARSIMSTRVQPPSRGSALPRIAALIALAIAITAFVLVVVLGVGS